MFKASKMLELSLVELVGHIVARPGRDTARQVCDEVSLPELRMIQRMITLHDEQEIVGRNREGDGSKLVERFKRRVRSESVRATKMMHAGKCRLHLYG